MKYLIFFFVPLWVFEMLISKGYTQCDPLPKNQIRCENEWEVAVFQYEEKIDNKNETYEIVKVIKSKRKKTWLESK